MAKTERFISLARGRSTSKYFLSSRNRSEGISFDIFFLSGSVMENPGVDLSETNGTRLLITISIFLALSWVAVTLRNYTRAYLIRSFRTDDWIMLIAQVSARNISCDLVMKILSKLTVCKVTFTIYSGFLYAGLEAGIGRHNAAIEDADREVAALKVRVRCT
jgi:hypothetical protein